MLTAWRFPPEAFNRTFATSRTFGSPCILLWAGITVIGACTSFWSEIFSICGVKSVGLLTIFTLSDNGSLFGFLGHVWRGGRVHRGRIWVCSFLLYTFRARLFVNEFIRTLLDSWVPIFSFRISTSPSPNLFSVVVVSNWFWIKSFCNTGVWKVVFALTLLNGKWLIPKGSIMNKLRWVMHAHSFSGFGETNFDGIGQFERHPENWDQMAFSKHPNFYKQLQKFLTFP